MTHSRPPRLADELFPPTLSAIRETFKVVKEDPSIANLCIGDPSFSPPPAVIAAMHEGVERGLSHYENDAGSPKLRAAVIEHENALRRTALHSYDNVVITNGGVNGIYSFSRSVLNPGDDVLLLQPVWIAFIQITRLLNCNPILVPTHHENDFIPAQDVLEAHVTPRTKILVVISPGNPTGAVYDETTMLMLHNFCEKHGLWLLHDEAYRDIVFGPYPQASLVGKSDRVVGIRTLSKSHAMTGYRVGWVISNNTALIDRVRLNVAYNVMCVCSVVQHAAVAALFQGMSYLKSVVSEYENRMNHATERLIKMGFAVHRPRGSFYVFPRHRYAFPIANRLLAEAGVAVVDGHHFGPTGANHFRISCAVDARVLESGLDRIERWVSDNPPSDG